MTQNIFLDVTAVMGIAVSIAFLMRLLRQPLIVGYLVAGVVVGPLFFGFISHGEALFETFATFGVIFLLFLIGMSLNVEYVRRMGKDVAVGGLLQFFLTLFAGYGIMVFIGFSSGLALAMGAAITFSSTIIISKLITDKKDEETVYGRYVIGLLLVQDIIAIALLLLLSFVGETADDWRQTIMLLFSRGVALLGVIFLLSRFVLPELLRRVAASAELLFLFTIAWCFAIASMVHLVGFSVEIGAVIAGVTLGASPFQREIMSRVRPLRDFFIVVFFLVLGSQMQFGNFREALGPAALLSLFILFVQPAILYGVLRSLRYTRRNAVLIGLTAAQVSEFGFILMFQAKKMGYVDDGVLSIFTATALITIVISSYLITYNEAVYRYFFQPVFSRLFGPDLVQNERRVEEAYDVWVFGYHRIGETVCDALTKLGKRVAVVDFHPPAIARAKAKGLPGFFGDAADVEFLDMLPLGRAKLIISTLPAVDDELTLLSHVRRQSKRVLVVANAVLPEERAVLYRAGANYAMTPHLLGGVWIAHILKERPWTRKTFASLNEEAVLSG